MRTILDLAAEDLRAAHAMPRAELSRALLRILDRQLITRAQVRSARIPEASRLLLKELLG